MSIGLLLTALFLILQLTGNIDWLWWQIALPIFIELGILLLFVIVWFGLLTWLSREF